MLRVIVSSWYWNKDTSWEAIVLVEVRDNDGKFGMITVEVRDDVGSN